MAEREPLTEGELREVGEYISGFTRGGHYMGPLLARLHREHFALGRRVAEQDEVHRRLVDANGVLAEKVAALETEVRLTRAVVDASRPIVNPTDEQIAEATGNYFIALAALAQHDKERS